jgi:hypothetical protein
MNLRPSRGVFLRPFGCGWFIREFLLGHGPYGAPEIDPAVGAPQSDVSYYYKEGLAIATATERSERIISDMVVAGVDVTLEMSDDIYDRELRKVSRKFTHMRYHSFLMYFGTLKRLAWVEKTGRTEASAMQDSYPTAPERTYDRLTTKGIEASEEMWSNPLFTLYPKIGPRHAGKPC